MNDTNIGSTGSDAGDYVVEGPRVPGGVQLAIALPHSAPAGGDPAVPEEVACHGCQSCWADEFDEFLETAPFGWGPRPEDEPPLVEEEYCWVDPNSPPPRRIEDIELPPWPDSPPKEG